MPALIVLDASTNSRLAARTTFISVELILILFARVRIYNIMQILYIQASVHAGCYLTCPVFHSGCVAERV